MQGGPEDVNQALCQANVAAAPVDEATRALLLFVEKTTRHAYRVTAADTQALRDYGWTDPQMAEAVYITALFAFFNRVADAFGLTNPGFISAHSNSPDIPLS